jgi:hypothetical protein
MRLNEQHLPAARLPFWRRLGWRLGAAILLLTALGILVSGLLRPARPLAEALTALKEESGAHFDPRVAEAALAISPERWAKLLELT